eukprot:TRINITY_DN1107_c0_g1_i1.p1 TRINITY_DN1107_c0_g1~~TRINITY_DN1107_c0_g1_i1.p1  ORF type:complete len:382 (+),score=13.92 TRINITY_DN1107_c0_g1_i1:127-1146(+)
MTNVIAGRYKLRCRIASGSFGDLYVAKSLTDGDDVAIKLEMVKTRHPQLLYESKVYRILCGHEGIPNVRWYGTESDHNILVMDLLGLSLEDLFDRCGRKFSLKCVLMLADQLLQRLEFLHSKNFIHRDVKPHNFLMGLHKKANIVQMIDFGLAKMYRDPKTQAHIAYSEHRALAGTARYASINAHLGVEQSRRDDLEALGYMFIYFLRGRLPWQGLSKGLPKGTNVDELIKEKKMATPIEVLCKGTPSEFAAFLHCARSLRFDQKPDYAYLRKLLRDLAIKRGIAYDNLWDWLLSDASEAAAEPDAEPHAREFKRRDSTMAKPGTGSDGSVRVLDEEDT